jgi:spermine synthase
VELDRFAETGQKFDYIFGDLTDIPLSSDTQDKEWQFLTDVISKSFKVLRPSGRFLTHGSGVTSVRSLALFESYLKSLQEPSVQFTRCQAFVPSFMEEWIFYQVWRSNEE